MIQSHRLDEAQSPLLDRENPMQFSFDGRSLTGFSGDSLASALIANGVHLTGRSFKYHRPRGIFGAGTEEPNALLTVGEGAYATPNSQATTTEVYDGLVAKSQNRWPSLRTDIMGINDALAPFLTAGFYYKTFMWPKSFWEKLYEPMIRRAAGLGALSGLDDPDTYDKGFLHCDVLVIGAGPAGLMAALTLARAGVRVILADDDFHFGGRLLFESELIDERPAIDWVQKVIVELESYDHVRLMSRSTVYGVYDHGIYGMVTRKPGHRVNPDKATPRETLWRIYAKTSILAAGATERGIAFANNDRPGIMLASAGRGYLNRYDAMVGRKVALLRNNDGAKKSIADLERAGVEIVADLDVREGKAIIDCKGRHHLRTLIGEGGQKIEADTLLVSGGWNPNLHLTCHHRGRPKWNEEIAAFVPDKANLPDGMLVAGAAAGHFSTRLCLLDGEQAAKEIGARLSYEIQTDNIPLADDAPYQVQAFWQVKSGIAKIDKKRAWVDLQNDVTAKDIALAAQEGFQSVEHVKRYTTLGMATDQGKTANVLGLGVLSEVLDQSIPQTGTTIFRPPYTPVSIGAFAGAARGQEFKPSRMTPSHDWAKSKGAVFVEAGLWHRAQYFPIEGEDHWRTSVDREVVGVRTNVGVCDVTTLGKIDVQGPDAAAFLNKIYVNGFAKLPIGKCRYGLMLREDGIAMDDGTAARFSDSHYVITTTTANAGSVYQHMEFCRQCLWPEMDVSLMSVTDQWAQYAIAGPKSRTVLEQLIDPVYDISNAAFPYMACGEVTLGGGIRARLFRLSFSGELAFELGVPARFGDSVIRAIMEHGAAHDIVAYGIESLGVMRIEKGHAAGNELNGQTSARELGLDRMVSQKKDCIGKILGHREGLNWEDGVRLVGFKPVDRKAALTAGSHLVAIGQEAITQNDQGYLTSSAYSPTLCHTIALGFLRCGKERIGETFEAVDPLNNVRTPVEVCSPHFVDPEGERLRG